MHKPSLNISNFTFFHKHVKIKNLRLLFSLSKKDRKLPVQNITYSFLFFQICKETRAIYSFYVFSMQVVSLAVLDWR
jgi:hypothetical protein